MLQQLCCTSSLDDTLVNLNLEEQDLHAFITRILLIQLYSPTITIDGPTSNSYSPTITAELPLHIIACQTLISLGGL